jgi:uncharacterized membrane protein YhhN
VEDLSNSPTLVVLVAFGVVLAMADWVAVGMGRHAVRAITKPTPMVVFIVVAMTLDPTDATIRGVFVVGLVLSLTGDIFLLPTGERWFLAGLTSFLLAHVAYIVGLLLAPTTVWGILAGVAVMLTTGTVWGRRVVGAVTADRTRSLIWPVVAYLIVISTMVVAAFGTGARWAIAGASLFYISDSILAWDRFVKPLEFGPVAVMVTYHLAQVSLVVWLI